jgi:hypothetical protein
VVVNRHKRSGPGRPDERHCPSRQPQAVTRGDRGDPRSYYVRQLGASNALVAGLGWCLMDTGIGTKNLYSACRVAGAFQHTTPYQAGGTGFVVQLADGRNVLVTNRHVVDYPWVDPAFVGSVLERVEVEVWRDTPLCAKCAKGKPRN